MENEDQPPTEGEYIKINGAEYEVIIASGDRVLLERANGYNELDEALADCFAQDNYESLRRSSGGALRVDITNSPQPKLSGGYARTIYNKTGMVPIASMVLEPENHLRVWFDTLEGEK